MMATAVSKVASKVKKTIIVKTRASLPEQAGDLKSTINKCPATIFAAKRTDKVIGRIIELTSSMITMKGLNGAGLPSGTKCANIVEEVFTQANDTCPNHRGKASLRVNTKWLVAVKM